MVKAKSMKIKTTIWTLFIVVAILVTLFNVYYLLGIYKKSENEHQHDEYCEHAEDMMIVHVDFEGINLNDSHTEIQSSIFAANNSTLYKTQNIIGVNNTRDVIYWYSDADNSVYKSSGENIEKLFEKQAIGFIDFDSVLYFISYDSVENSSVLRFGHIWTYNHASNELSQFSDILVNSLSILDGNLFCLAMEEGIVSPYIVSVDNDWQKMESVICGSYRNYFLAYDYAFDGFAPLYLMDAESGEKTLLLTNSILISELCIYKDSLYYIYHYSVDEADKNSGALCSLNLLTGEKKVYDMKKIFGHTHNLSYNFANNKIYLMSEKRIAEIDLLTDKVTRKNIRHNQSHLYSDGETIYLVLKDKEETNHLTSFNDFKSFHKLVK
ncbi:MAG: hypothetical protein LBC96_04635 [Lachnospiraceae bacterium]|jgi:hypothetical protein|nr:hypothetical protein [Lachnospiraceae bacterium]